MSLDEHVADAETAQEEGHGQAHEGAAHHEDGDLVIGSLLHRALQRRVLVRQVRRNVHAPSGPLPEGFRVLNHPPGSRESRASEDRHRIKKR
ncbi:hypothetical protein GCM10011578_002480 [Streptomyces fuscichromogenes]|uniref:Uncharacterized protein n=1 Tax=Streptomyces fuscichromogenes TaxID=1324013 RepID=A0A917X7W0_9ACTN|nr:hypothetical protein GCM10011578_002480 [Streptomyces fuscichromogenes]